MICCRVASDRMGAALVFVPEVPLRDAIAMLPVCGVGLQNALGTLAPPEVACTCNGPASSGSTGALCGGYRAMASMRDSDAIPDWLVVGFTLPLLALGIEPGTMPDRTALFEEGCADVDPERPIEAWGRHTLNWIARWEDEGVRPPSAGRRGHVSSPADGYPEGVAMELARAIHFDESDQRVYASPARTGEWCVSGGFEFSEWTESDLTGKARQAFSNGWFGLETGGA